MIAVGFPLSMIVRHRPEPYGMHKDGVAPGSPADTTATGAPRAKQYDFTAKQALRTSSFWLIALGHGSALLIVAALQVHLTLHLTENLDYTLAQAASDRPRFTRDNDCLLCHATWDNLGVPGLMIVLGPHHGGERIEPFAGLQGIGVVGSQGEVLRQGGHGELLVRARRQIQRERQCATVS